MNLVWVMVNLYRLMCIRKTVNHKTKVRKSYNVKFEMRCDYEVPALYGKMLIMKNGKIILKIKSGEACEWKTEDTKEDIE